MLTDDDADRLVHAQKRAVDQHMRKGCRIWMIFTAVLVFIVAAIMIYLVY